MPKTLNERYSWAELTAKIIRESESDSPSFEKWVKSKEGLGGNFFSSLLWKRLYNIQKSVNKEDRDHFIVISGKEGSGKSTLAIQGASVLDPDFCIKKICYKPIQFIHGLKEARKGDTFELDEGNLFLFSRESMGYDNKSMVKLFAIMRQKNLVVIICVPNFFTLDSYVRDHRVDTLIQIYKRGNFHCYTGKAIKIISREGSRFKNVTGIKVPYGTFFTGSFNKQMPIINDLTDEAYRENKGEQFDEFLNELEEAAGKMETAGMYLGIKDAAAMLNVSTATIYKLIWAKKLQAKQMGAKWVINKEYLQKYGNNIVEGDAT